LKFLKGTYSGVSLKPIPLLFLIPKEGKSFKENIYLDKNTSKVKNCFQTQPKREKVKWDIFPVLAIPSET